MTAINRYDEYGIPASTNSGYHGYTGQMWLPELNLWYYRARIYSSELGRFLQTDPIGYEDQVNLYAYARNDPLNVDLPRLSRLNRATAILENGPAILVTIAYDALGRRSSLTRPGAGSTSYAYDGASRLQSLGHDFSGTTNDVAFTFGFNPASQILSRTSSNETFSWTASATGPARSRHGALRRIWQLARLQLFVRLCRRLLTLCRARQR